jgi:drug/metabolite transporter (DMT)-like permease
LTIDLKSLAILAYLGIVQVGIAFILFVTWSGYLKASQTGLIVILEAVFGPVWPWIWLSEKPGSATFVGGAVIITALVLHSLYVGRPTDNAASVSWKSG